MDKFKPQKHTRHGREAKSKVCCQIQHQNKTLNEIEIHNNKHKRNFNQVMNHLKIINT